MTEHTLRKRWILTLAKLYFVTVTQVACTIEPRIINSQGIGIPDNPTSQVYSVTLLDEPQIQRTRGHHHSPYGVHGKNKYLYDGKIQVNRINYQLRSRDHEPIAAIALESDLFLLTKGYFSHNEQSFIFYRADAQRTFQPIGLDIVRTAFWNLTFREHNQTCTYRVWLLHALAEGDSVDTAIEQFCLLTDNDARFGLFEEWHDSLEVAGPDIKSFVARTLLYSKNKKAVPALIKMVRVLRKDDDPTTMSCILHCLLKLGGANTEAVICEFRASIPDLKDQSDMRALAWMDTPQLHVVNCPTGDAPASSGK